MGVSKGDLSECNLWGEYILIFICVGSREYQFDRLIRKIDELVEAKEIQDEILAQIGQSKYEPKNFKYKRFMSVAEFKEYQNNADLIISHGGTGALIGALKLHKQVIAVPRLAKFQEHTDDHQTQVAGVLAKEGYLKMVINIDEIAEEINNIKKNPITKIYNRPSNVFNIICNFIENNL